MLHLFDTARGKVVPFEPIDPPRVSMYVCGPTVYADPHIGHGRFALVFDVLRRYLEWSGYEVRYVSNITDVDDKIIGKALDEGRSEPDVAAEFEKTWFDAADRLGIARPDESPRATEYTDEMVALVSELVAGDLAYELEDGVYLDTSKIDGYGLLARQSLESLQSGARVAVDEAKRNPIDFALWKKAKEGEPAWDSPWGPGRPGWHTECVVMAHDLLGDEFDLHGGGIDLAFPHHENERAQAVARRHPFARHWMHNGMVELGGEKMAKSVGNVTDLGSYLDSHDPRAYRLLVLRSHYRSPIEVTDVAGDDASAALQGLDALARRVGDEALSLPDGEVLDCFRDRMDDDLDTAAAMAAVFDARRDANAALDAGDEARGHALAAAVIEACGAVGLVLRGGADEVPPEILAKAAARYAARAAGDYALADALRDEITAEGWVVEDGRDGTRVRFL